MARKTPSPSCAPKQCEMTTPAPSARAVEETDEKEDERARGADCRQRIGAQELPHDDGVRRVVQLLEHLAEENGHGELDDEQVGAALRHVLNGG